MTFHLHFWKVFEAEKRETKKEKRETQTKQSKIHRRNKEEKKELQGRKKNKQRTFKEQEKQEKINFRGSIVFTIRVLKQYVGNTICF